VFHPIFLHAPDKCQGAADTADELEDAMRVPIFPADLLPKQSFSRLAKELKRNWPGDTPLPLSSAQETLSRGLGYRDFHDLQQSAKNTDPIALWPTQNEARDGISTSIFATCQPNGTQISDQDLDRLVKLLPLQELLAFHASGPGRAAASVFPSKPPANMQLTSGDAVPESAGDQDNTDSIARRSSPSTNLISEAELKSVWEAVQRRGNLRDQCLFSLLLQGMRANEVRAVKRSNFFEWNAEHVMLELVVNKTRGRPMTMAMPGSFLTLVDKYVQQAGLSGDDLLFPSSLDPSVPMSSGELSRVIGSCLRDALTDPALRSAHMIRKSVAAQMGHESRSSTSDYIASLPKKPGD
jgi:hypothetical protein